MEYTKQITPKQFIILQQSEVGGILKLIDNRNNKTEEIILATW